MSQHFARSYVIKQPGFYTIKAERLPETDILSVYVNRVKKLWSDTEDTVESHPVPLGNGDVIESTGTLTLVGTFEGQLA